MAPPTSTNDTTLPLVLQLARLREKLRAAGVPESNLADLDALLSSLGAVRITSREQMSALASPAQRDALKQMGFLPDEADARN